MNPASQGNHNQLTAPLLLWCKAAGPWSVLTWLPVMLNDIDWRWVSAVHLIEWLLPAGLLEMKTNADYNRKERQMPTESFQMTKLCVLLWLHYIHVYWKFSCITFMGGLLTRPTELSNPMDPENGCKKTPKNDHKKWSMSLLASSDCCLVSQSALVLYKKSGKASVCVPSGLLTYLYIVTLCFIICVPVFSWFLFPGISNNRFVHTGTAATTDV